jgi:hypothetical protein
MIDTVENDVEGSEEVGEQEEATPVQPEGQQEQKEAMPPNDESDYTEKKEEETKEPETPEWFMKDKYKSVEEQAKSAFELQKKMGKYWGSPQDKYSVEGMEGIDKNDPLIENLSPVLKEMGISQEGFKHLVNEYMNANSKMVQSMEEELKKTLTTTDAHTYNSINKWMAENLTKEESDMVKNNWLMSAADFKLFNQLRLMAAPSTSVPNSATNAVQFESSQAVENDKIKYKKELRAGSRVQDKNYENELAARFRDAIARELRNK